MAWAALARAGGLWPWAALRALGAAVGWLAGTVLRIRRRHVEDAMRVAGVADAPGRARAMYRALGTSAVEFLWLAARGREALEHVRIDAASRERWTATLARGRGVVVAASHTGNWDLAACAIAREVPLLVVTKRLSVGSIDAFWQSTRARLGVRLAPARGAMARARTMLAGRGAVAMMLDQVPASARHGVKGEVLGAAAWIDRAPAALAARAGAPLVVAAARRGPDGEHVLHLLAVFEPPARPAREWIDDATRGASRALEAFVREHPDQWLWLHRRWRDPPGARAHVSAMIAGPCKTRSSSPAAPFRAA
jgi:Kdo2-lipid IVA lauroyltransferase/acyltransferase